MTATAVLLVTFATVLLIATVLTYERMLREERARTERAEEHAEQCQALLVSRQRHPANGPARLSIVKDGASA